MMSGNPNWWSINSMYPQSHQLSSQFVFGASSNPSPADHHHNPSQDFPVRSWSQLLLGTHGGGGEGGDEEEEERFESSSLFHQLDNNSKKPNNSWDHHGVKQEGIGCNQPNYSHHHQLADDHYNNDHHHHHHHHRQANVSRSSSSSSAAAAYCWPATTQLMPLVSSPTSCITTSLSNNSSILSFSGVQNSNNKRPSNPGNGTQHNQDRSSRECNEASNNGGVSKKARVQQSSTQPAMKVRKEKLGDRITALHQLVSPFGKTDTASVLSEAIGYIGFLQGQIEALSSPYMRNGSSGRTSHRHQHSVQERNSMFHEAHSQQGDLQENGAMAVKDLRSRGLCLVPISCTQHMASSDNGADYWAQPALGGGF